MWEIKETRKCFWYVKHKVISKSHAPNHSKYSIKSHLTYQRQFSFFPQVVYRGPTSFVSTLQKITLFRLIRYCKTVLIKRGIYKKSLVRQRVLSISTACTKVINNNVIFDSQQSKCSNNRVFIFILFIHFLVFSLFLFWSNLKCHTSISL